MAIEDFWKAQQLESEKHTFKSLVMCLMIQSIQGSQRQLKEAFPKIWKELCQYQRKDKKEKP